MRKAMPQSEYALPGKRYPIPDKGHAKAALGRVSEFGSPAEKARVKRKVRRLFPKMKMKGAPAHRGMDADGDTD